MEVRPGYKQTEVGVIPEEWDVRSLAEVCSKITDGTHDTPTPVSSGVPFLTAIHIKENFIDYEGCLFLTEEDHRVIFARCNPKRGDVLMVNIGAGVATTAFVDVNFEFSLKNVALLKPANSLASGRFLNHCLIKRKAAITQALSSGGAQPFLSLSRIGEIRIPAPALPEQRAIAEALSDVDGLLGGLDRLIAKQRNLKQAAMQQLLTSQTRLPGFQGEWDFAELKSLYAKVFKKSPLSSADGRTLGAYPLFVSGGEAKRTDLALFQNTEALIISDGGVFDVKYFSGDFSVTDHCFVISLKGDMRFYFQWMSLRKAELDLMTFKGSGLRNLDKPTFGKVEAPLPPPAEQTAIAEVLTEMDAELAALEQRREKTRALKQAMMQELLTGKTRLVSTGEAHA